MEASVFREIKNLKSNIKNPPGGLKVGQPEEPLGHACLSKGCYSFQIHHLRAAHGCSHPTSIIHHPKSFPRAAVPNSKSKIKHPKSAWRPEGGGRPGTIWRAGRHHTP